MPFPAIYPDIRIPEVDLWGLMFEEEREEKFPFDQSRLAEKIEFIPDVGV